MGRPLRSTPITGASSLLRTGPPARPASVLNTSQFLLLGALPLTTPNHAGGGIGTCLPTFHAASRRSGSRRLPAGHRQASKRAPARLIPGQGVRPGFDVTYWLSTLHQRFTCVRLPDPHLTPWGAFSSSLTTHGIQPAQHEAV